MDLRYCELELELKEEGTQGLYEGYFNVFGNVDEGGDRVWPGAFAKTLQESGRKVAVMYMHEHPVGPPPDELREDSRGLYARGRITLESFWGREAWVLLRDGAIRQGSIGYRPIKWDYTGSVRNLREIQLYEISFVPVGMNRETSVRAVKAALPPHETAKAPEDAPWDAGEVLREAEGARVLRLIHAWYDPDGDPDAKSSYKLPHHYVDGRVVWRGVAAAGAALMGARGGVIIPEADIPGVKRHLAAHYRQFNRVPPWEEEAGLNEYIDALRIIGDELKAGRVLSQANYERVQAAMDAMREALARLEELIAAAQPQEEESALRTARLMRRLRAAELALACAAAGNKNGG